MHLNKDFKEFIALLNEHEVKYLVLGGYAVNFYGYPRYTKDIDFWIWLDDDNISRLLKALEQFGFGNVGLSKADFLNRDAIVQLGFAPNRIDLIMELDGADFMGCYARKTKIAVDETIIDFLALDDLIEVKKQAGRAQDLADAENLEKIRQREKE